MKTFNLPDLLLSAGQKMKVDFDENLVSHRGEKGIGREQVLRQFLASHLPKKFEISSGFAFDSSGEISKQLDVVIADGLASPRFEAAGGVRFFPCESLVAVGQVRSAVTSRAALREALANLESAKILDRSAKGRAFDSRYGEPIDSRTDHLHQLFTFLFITGRALKGERAREELLSYITSRPAWVWPNIIIAHGKYILTYCYENGVCPNVMHACGISLQDASKRPDILMRFYLLLGGAIEVTRVSGLPYWEYLAQAGGWNAEAMYSTSTEPPPLLGDILRA